MEKYIAYLVKWLQNKLIATKCKGFIVGISGGIDSAVVANLVRRACPDNSLGVILPCYSATTDVEHAKLVCEECGLKYKTINLAPVYDTLLEAFDNDIKDDPTFELALANTKARLRMTTLYAIAQRYGYLVVGTDNACEWYTGYFTKYGDGGVDLVPLVHLLKSQVYEMAQCLQINQAIITKAPSAGLIAGQTDEDELQFTYHELEQYMKGQEVSKKVKQRIDYLHHSSEHKRNLAAKPALNVEDINK